VLAWLAPQPVSGSIRITTSDAITIAWIVAFEQPLADTAYADGSGTLLQSLALEDGAVSVSATCHDELRRPAIVTKAARIAGALPGYRPGFVTAIDWDSGVMQGEVADAYPADEGYPYFRRRYDNAPTSHVIETGNAGKTLAIDLRVPEAERHTTLSRLYTNSAASPIDLPAHRYIVETVLDADRIPAVTYRDQQGNVLATWAGTPGNDPDSFTLTRNYYDAAGNLAKVLFPNYFFPTVAGHKNFYSAMEYDFFGRQIRAETPDSRPFAYCQVYDDAGRIRFMQDPNGAVGSYLLYRIYDSVGRLQEEGSCAADGPWVDIRSTLQANANDRTWLPSPGTWLKRFEYDGDGADANQIGRLVRTQTPEVTETFLYDERGGVRQKTTAAADFLSGQAYVTDFTRDNAGHLTAMTYDTGIIDKRFEVSWDYNLRGQITDVHCGGELLARYGYDALGAVVSEIFLPDQAGSLERQYVFNPAGMLARIADPYFTETLEYFAGGYNGARSYTGQTVKSSVTFSGFTPDEGFITRVDQLYAYSPLKRLTTAECSAGEQWSMGVAQPFTFDANGNSNLFGLGATPSTFHYDMGTDRLVDSSNGTAAQYGYDASGNVVSSEPRGIAGIHYGALSQRTTRFDLTDGRSIECIYDSAGHRVLRRSNGSTTLSLLAGSGNPVVQIAEDGSFVGHVFGPNGRIATIGQRRLFFLKDRLSSTRALYDGSSIRAAYNFTQTGELLGQAYEPTGRLTLYLFTGQEFEIELGLYNFKARFYDPAIGRFYSMDPASQYPSPYIYAGGDWINYTDPTGMWSLGKFSTIFFGVALIVGGAALTVLTLGASTGVLVAAAIVGGALIGAGFASVEYGMQLENDGDFDVAAWGIKVLAGAALGAVSGAIGSGFTGSSLRAAFALETVAGIALGAVEGVVANGLTNLLVEDEDFLDGAVAAAGLGALAGGLGGALGGAIGRGANVRNSRLLRQGREAAAAGTDGVGRLGVARTGDFVIGHALVGIQRRGGDWQFSQLTGGSGAEAKIEEFLGFDFNRTWAWNIELPNIDPAQALLLSSIKKEHGTYSTLTNSCWTWPRELATAAGLRTPPWVTNPATLSWWFRLLAGPG
jgi:RHS repeat-associated protein